MKVELSEELRGVFEQLIPHYEKCIQELPLDDDKRNYFLRLNKITHGICWASDSILNIDISCNIRDINKLFGLSVYWFNTPISESHEEAQKALQLRVDAMKSLLKNGTINV